MKVYRSFTIDMATGEVEAEDSYEYQGPVAECKGGGKGGGKAASQAADQSRRDEEARQQRIREGTSSINTQFDSQFNDGYFGSRQKSYMDYATPQLDDQYKDAQKKLTFALDRTGTLDSSIRAQREAELQKLYDTNRQQVADKALGYSTGARNSVEEARADLIRTLNNTGDNEAAVRSAQTRAQMLSQPDTYSPLGQLFATFTNALGQQAGYERAASLGGEEYGGRYNTGLFGVAKDSVKNT